MISDRVLHVMRHATAWPKRYRNHFNAEEGHHDWDALTEACDAGLMQRNPGNSWIPGYIFTVTDAGLEALAASGSKLGPMPRALRDVQLERLEADNA